MSELQNNIEVNSMLPVGTLLQGGKYRSERYLSSGGFGNTYVATNIEFDEQVAIKEFFMRGISQRDDDSISVSVSNQTNLTQFVGQKEKFRKEARRLRKLRNSHIVAVHDLFEENGTVYYEMDLIKGESLSERLKRTGQPLSETEVLKILHQVLDALAIVHAKGLYHLDLKPANIMMDQTGCALLIDFGASKQMSAGNGESVSTTSALAFTPGYAPLEQTEQNMKNFGPWTDLYALGATLYKLLTNQTPPSASEILMARNPLVFPADVSQHMRDLIAWMMKPRIDERPQSVAEVKRFLNNHSKDEATKVMTIIQPKVEKAETVLVESVERTEKTKTIITNNSNNIPLQDTRPKMVSASDNSQKSKEKLSSGIKDSCMAKVIPEIIGDLIFYDTTNPNAEPPKTKTQYIRNKIVTVIVVIVILASLYFLYNIYEWNVWLCVGIGVFTLLAGIGNFFDQVFDGKDYFVGSEGFAIYDFKDERENIIKKEELKYDDFDYMLHEETAIYKDHKYEGTSYKFTMIKFDEVKKELYRIEGSYKNKKEQLYNFAKKVEEFYMNTRLE